jgi:alanyl-tRNA synthetase
MSTHRLYFDDSDLARFAARVVARDGMRVALDRTAFYPEGGGQPADHGMLNGVPVVDVQVDDAGVVWHALAGPLDTEDVTGTLDWPRRLDHMQQHHGQHLLSAAFEELFDMKTVSFHLGVESSTIDLAAPAVTEGQLEAAEARVNQVIWENRPVYARFVGKEELPKIPLRKPPTVSGTIRVVSVPDFDHSACGGTHPRATGSVGLLHIRRTERRGAETRVEFVCGGRALRDLRRKDQIVTRLAGQASVGLDELEDAITRLRADHASTRRQLAEALGRLHEYEADFLMEESGTRLGESTVVSMVFDDREVEEVKALAREMSRRGGHAVVAARIAERATLVFAASIYPSDFDAGRLLKDTLAKFGGKGGGSELMAQGALADPAKAEEAVRWAAERTVEG